MATPPPYRPYPSISNRLKLLQEALDKGFVPRDVVWVASPKFHGVNTTVTVSVPSGTVWLGRRNGYLDLAKESHYDAVRVVGKYPWSRLATLFPAASVVTVYGELYGGVFGDMKGEGAVQREVHYDPKRAFVMFDVAVDDVMLDVYDMMQVARQLGVPVPPIVHRGLPQDVYAWARAHAEDPALLMDPTLDPAHLHGAPNTGEGWVIRPTKECTFRSDGRVLLKVKSVTFDETCKQAKPTPGAAAPTVVYEVPVARVTAVLSKEADTSLTMRDLPRLANLVVQDIVADTPDMNVKILRKACFEAVGSYLQHGHPDNKL